MTVQTSNCPVFDFIDGQKDAKEGVPADQSRSDDYQRGYGFEYELQEIKSNGGMK